MIINLTFNESLYVFNNGLAVGVISVICFKLFRSCFEIRSWCNNNAYSLFMLVFTFSISSFANFLYTSVFFSSLLTKLLLFCVTNNIHPTLHFSSSVTDNLFSFYQVFNPLHSFSVTFISLLLGPCFKIFFYSNLNSFANTFIKMFFTYSSISHIKSITWMFSAATLKSKIFAVW